MTKWQRIRRVAGGLFLLLFALVMAAVPQYGRLFIMLVLAVSAIWRGLERLLYYLTMARYAVGGKIILIQGVFLLDFGLFTLNFASFPGQYVMIYLVISYLFYGLIDAARAMEIRRRGIGSWRRKLLTGAGNIALAVLCLAKLGSEEVMTYVYSFGMIWSALGMIVSAFRRTAVPYIQQA